MNPGRVMNPVWGLSHQSQCQWGVGPGLGPWQQVAVMTLVAKAASGLAEQLVQRSESERQSGQVEHPTWVDSGTRCDRA